MTVMFQSVTCLPLFWRREAYCLRLRELPTYRRQEMQAEEPFIHMGRPSILIFRSIAHCLMLIEQRIG